MTAKHGTGTPATYILGTAAVDHAGGSKGVFDKIEEIGLTEFLKFSLAYYILYKKDWCAKYNSAQQIESNNS
eukprot:15088430-Ditylum_brightwellii.AAC.1